MSRNRFSPGGIITTAAHALTAEGAMESPSDIEHLLPR
jgi:hypothetical protein